MWNKDLGVTNSMTSASCMGCWTCICRTRTLKLLPRKRRPLSKQKFWTRRDRPPGIFESPGSPSKWIVQVTPSSRQTRCARRVEMANRGWCQIQLCQDKRDSSHIRTCLLTINSFKYSIFLAPDGSTIIFIDPVLCYSWNHNTAQVHHIHFYWSNAHLMLFFPRRWYPSSLGYTNR